MFCFQDTLRFGSFGKFEQGLSALPELRGGIPLVVFGCDLVVVKMFGLHKHSEFMGQKFLTDFFLSELSVIEREAMIEFQKDHPIILLNWIS